MGGYYFRKRSIDIIEPVKADGKFDLPIQMYQKHKRVMEDLYDFQKILEDVIEKGQFTKGGK